MQTEAGRIYFVQHQTPKIGCPNNHLSDQDSHQDSDYHYHHYYYQDSEGNNNDV